MNVRTTAFSCPDCGSMLLSPAASCHCKSNPGFPSGDLILEEARFAPVGDHIGDLAAVSRVDLDTTVVRTRRLRDGFATVVEPRGATQFVTTAQPSASVKLFAGFLRSAALVAMAAFVGGSTVYFFQPGDGGSAPATLTPVRETPPPAVTDISSAGPFVNRVEQDAPLAPSETSPAARDGRHAPPKASAVDVAGEPSTKSSASRLPDSGEQDAKVGAYVAENPAARTPTARCADGTFSFAASKDAACAGRGGVSDGNMSGKTPVRNAAYVLGPRGGCHHVDASGKKTYVEKKYCN